MLKKSFFKLVCLALVLCSGLSLLLVNGRSQTVSADAGTISATDAYNYCISLSDFSSEYTSGTIPSEYCMRDDYVIYTTSQSDYGLCWSFASSSMLTTTIMKATGEYYDFSEGWASAVLNYLSHDSAINSALSYIYANDYRVGGGGNFLFYDYMVKRIGLVLESDLPYEEFQNLCDENVDEAYNFYSAYVNTEIMENLVSGQFDVSSYYSGSTAVLKSMKWHIMNNGGIYFGTKWGTVNNGVATKTIGGKQVTYKLANTSSTAGHAVTLIGWDDNINVNGSTGAWIALNSWDDSFGDNGIFYISYDDTDVHSLFGYRYTKNSDNLYFNTSLKSSTASYTTDFAGAYYGDFSASENKTLQKNIFFEDYVAEVNGNKVYSLNYDYDITAGASIEEVKVYWFDQDVTKDFAIDIGTKNKMSVSANNLKSGTYKIITTYSNGATTEEYLNAFYVMDGAELGSVTYYFGYINNSGYTTQDDSEGSVVNNGLYSSYLDYNMVDNSVVLATTNSTGSVVLWLQFSCYSCVTGTTYGSISHYSYFTHYRTGISTLFAVQIDFDLSVYTTYPIALVKSNGEKEILNVTILNATDTSNFVSVFYNTDGGLNSENNLKRVLVSTTSSAQIYAPTKDGYLFKGWYTDSNLTTALTEQYNYYLLSQSNIKTIANPTVDDTVQPYYNSYYGKSVYVYLYAKWEKLGINVTFHYNNGLTDKEVWLNYGDLLAEPTGFSKTGYTFMGWYTDSNFLTKWDFTSTVTASFELYAKWQINTYTITINYNNGSNDVTSTISYGEKITEPIVTRSGYTLIGWYTENNFVNLWSFDTAVTDNTSLFAKWQLNTPTDLQITSVQTVYDTATNFTITLEYNHEIKSKLSVSVGWYRNGAVISGQNGLTLTDKVYTAGVYSYSAVLKITHEGSVVETETNALTIYINQKDIAITNITYGGNGEVSWVDADASATYKVKLYKNGISNPIYQSTEQASRSINVWFSIKNAGYGSYYLLIEKYLGSDPVGSISSKMFNIYEVSFETYFADNASDFANLIVDEGYNLQKPTTPSKTGYVFENWYIDSLRQNKCEFPLVVTSNKTIYANYSLNALAIDEISKLEGVYNSQQFLTTSVVVNDARVGTYSYAWYKLVDSVPVDIENYTSELNVKYVKDTGSYYCVVKLVDNDGFSVTTSSNTFEVNIQKAQTEISVANMQKYFTYNGSIQTVGGSAQITREDEPVTIQYFNNTFVDVPDGGVLVVTVFAPASENYAEKTIYVDVTVNKAQGIIEADGYQVFTYIARQVYPTYKLNNNEQSVTCSEELKNVNKYEGVILTANESRNYLSASVDITLEILPATIQIKAKDVTSVWLFPMQKLSYEITGEYYGEQINVELICDVDVSKIGEYLITVQIDNPNYKVRLITGTYTVSVLPYIALLLGIIFAIVVAIIIKASKKYVIEFNENGGKLLKPIETKNRNALKLDTPVRAGYQFKGWYIDEDLTKEYDFNKVKKGKPVNVYARWEKQNIVNVSAERETKVEQILKDLNIRTNSFTKSPEVVIQEEIKAKQPEPAPEKSKEEIMQELINKATSANSKNFNSDEIESLIKNITKKD